MSTIACSLVFAFVCMCTQIDDKLNPNDKKVEKPNAKHEPQKTDFHYHSFFQRFSALNVDGDVKARTIKLELR